MKTDVTFFRSFQFCTQCSMVGHNVRSLYRNRMGAWEKKLKLLYLEEILSSFELTYTNDKTPQSLSNSKILGSVY